jgi:hypothetical protein
MHSRKEDDMSIKSFLQTWQVIKHDTPPGKKYGPIPGTNLVRAPSGEEALRLAGMDGRTQAGNKFTVANHKGNGVYEIKAEDWPQQPPAPAHIG